MKIIDLLNKIANEEEVPKYIRYRDILKHKYNIMMVCKENIIYKLDQCVINLNDEVEILEEEKKSPTLNDIRESYGLPRIEENKIPEKLSTWFSVETKQSKELNIEYANTNFENMYEKINEIIDYLKSKGE